MVLKEKLTGTNINQIQKYYAQKRYLNLLVDPSFQGVNRLFLLFFENENDRESHSNYYLLKEKIEIYNVMIDGKTFMINQ